METLRPKNNNALPENLQVDAVNTNRTRGEKFFDFFTYQIVNFGMNELLSLAIVDLFLGGTKEVAGDNPTSFFAQKFGDKGRNASDWLKKKQDLLNSKVGETGGNVFTLNIGGHFMAAFVKVLENNRTGLSKKFDSFFDSITGTKLDARELAKRETRYEILRNTPTKSGWTVAKGRLTGMAASIIINQIPESIDKDLMKNAPSDGQYGIRRATGITGKAIEPLVGGIAKVFGAEAKSEMGQKRLKYWSEVVLFETWCTTITSFVMEKFIKRHDGKIADDVTAPESAPVDTPKPTENRETQTIANSTSRKFADDLPEKGPWKEKKYGYDHEDEVGINI